MRSPRRLMAKVAKPNTQFDAKLFKVESSLDFPKAFLIHYIESARLGEQGTLANIALEPILSKNFKTLAEVEPNDIQEFDKRFSDIIKNQYAQQILERQKQRAQFCKNLKADLKLAIKASGLKLSRSDIKLYRDDIKRTQKIESEKYRKWLNDPNQLVVDNVKKLVVLARSEVIARKAKASISPEVRNIPPPPTDPAPRPKDKTIPPAPDYVAPRPKDKTIPPAPDYAAPRPKDKTIPPASDYPAPKPIDSMQRPQQGSATALPVSDIEKKFDQEQEKREARAKHAQPKDQSGYAAVEEFGEVVTSAPREYSSPSQLQESRSAQEQLASTLSSFISEHKVSKADKATEHEKEQWALAKGLLQEKLNKKQSKHAHFNKDNTSFKISRNKNDKLDNSFMYINGNLYRLKEHKVLGKGGFAKVKMLENEQGQLFAVKVVKSKQDLQREITLGDKLGRNVGYFERKREKAVQRKVAKRDAANDALNKALEQLEKAKANSAYQNIIETLEQKVARREEQLQKAQIALQNVSNNDKDLKQYIIQPYLGMSIEAILKTTPNPSQELMQHLAGMAIDAVMKVHDEDIIHRDLHAGNILVGPKDGKIDGEMTANVADFGLSDELPPGSDHIKGRMGPFNAIISPPEYVTVTYQPDKNGHMFKRARLPVGGETIYSKSSDVYQLGMMLKYQFDLSSTMIERMISANPQQRPTLAEVRQEIANMKFGGNIVPDFSNIEGLLIQEAREKLGIIHAPPPLPTAIYSNNQLSSQVSPLTELPVTPIRAAVYAHELSASQMADLTQESVLPVDATAVYAHELSASQMADLWQESVLPVDATAVYAHELSASQMADLTQESVLPVDATAGYTETMPKREVMGDSYQQVTVYINDLPDQMAELLQGSKAKIPTSAATPDYADTLPKGEASAETYQSVTAYENVSSQTSPNLNDDVSMQKSVDEQGPSVTRRKLLFAAPGAKPKDLADAAAKQKTSQEVEKERDPKHSLR